MIADNIYHTFMYSPQISKDVKPGQFINILPSSDWNYVMRRPMSVASQDGDIISIIYKNIGPGTSIMSKWKKDEEVDVIGPLGNYWEGYEQAFPIIIGGGVGIAPIYYLHNHLNLIKKEHCIIMGARSKSEHFLEHQEDKMMIMTTDDGSYGLSGNVIDALESIIDRCATNIKIYSCGPAPMMDAVKKYSQKHAISCDLALETIMACGIGICQGCTVELESDDDFVASYRKKFALACIDGPVFCSEDIIRC